MTDDDDDKLFTEAEFEEYSRMLEKGGQGTAGSLQRTTAQSELTHFVRRHGNAKCWAMFDTWKERRREKKRRLQ